MIPRTIFLMRTWLPRPRFWPDNWAACWKRPGRSKFRARNTAARKSWPRPPRPCTELPMSTLSLRPSPTVSVCYCAPVWCRFCFAVRDPSNCAPSPPKRPVSAGEAITISLNGDQHSLGSIISPGTLIAAPFRTAHTQGAILVYPRPDGGFTPEEKSLVSIIAGFGAVAVAHAELCFTAQGQARELHQLLEISS